MKLFKSTHFRMFCMLVLITGLGLNACKDSSTSAFEDEEIIQTAEKTAIKGKILAQAGQIIIDSFDEGQQTVGPLNAYGTNRATDLYVGPGPIGDRREVLGEESHPVSTTFTVSGTAPGENRISYAGGSGATTQELRYGTCIDPISTGRTGLLTYSQAVCNPNSPQLNANFSSMTGIDIDFINLLGGSEPNYWRIVAVLHSGTGAMFTYVNTNVPYKQGPFTITIPISEFSNNGTAPTATDLADIDGIAIAMGNNGNFSTSKDIAISEIRAVGENTEPVANTYVSNSSIQTWDPVFPSSEDRGWTSTVCYQDNTFGIDANWVNPHNAFEVTKDDGSPHPWEGNTFDAKWINSYNDMDSEGPGGHNWSKYETQVTGDGEFVIQLLADNCSWVYLADENGDNPQLIGYQAVTSSPGEYGVTLDGNHTLTFVIFDGGGLAGGKFRLETTENFGGPTPPPIYVNHAPIADAGPDQSMEIVGTIASVSLDGSSSSDANNDALAYSWFLNGTQVATGASPTLDMERGSYTITLIVDDGNGATASDDVTVEILNTAPVAVASVGATVLGTTIQFNGSASSDANGDALTYSWNFGDGYTGSGVTISHDYTNSGSFQVSLTVTDSYGDSDTNVLTIAIEGRPYLDYGNNRVFDPGIDEIVPMFEFATGKYDAKKVPLVIPVNTPDITAKKIHIKAEGITMLSRLIATDEVKLDAKKGSVYAVNSYIEGGKKVQIKAKDGVDITSSTITGKDVKVYAKYDNLTAVGAVITAGKEIKLKSKSHMDLRDAVLTASKIKIEAKGSVDTTGTVFNADKVSYDDYDDNDYSDEDDD